MTLTELKAKAASLGLTPDDVRQHGSLTKKATWENAIAEFEQWKTAVNTHCEEMGIPQWSNDGEGETETAETISVTLNETEGNNSSEDLPFDPTHTLIDGEWVEVIVDSIVPVPFTPSEPIPTIEPEVEMNGWHRWDEKLQQWIKEDPEETLKDCYQPESESYRQQLLKRMKPYVGDCIQSEDFEQLKNEPLDESTAAIYLGLLEESERILTETIAS